MKTSETVSFIEQNPLPLLGQIRAARPYKIPKGYLDWRGLSVLVTIAATFWDKPGNTPGALTVFHRLTLWLVQDAPLYLISSELLEAFCKTDILDRSDLLLGIEPPLPTFILLPPIGALKTPAGDAVEHLVVHFSDRRYPERSSGESPAEFGIDLPAIDHAEEVMIHCAAGDAAGIVWYCGIGILADGTLQYEGSIAEKHEPDDPAFMENLRSLALQAVLTLQYQPELISNAVAPPKSKGFGGAVKAEAQDPYRRPRWLGKDYKPKQEGGAARGTHASPRTHWRRGHLRHQAIGEGRNERKIVWIQPVLVNSEN